VLRHFETREEVYLQLTAQGWRAWRAGFERRLAWHPKGWTAGAARLEISNALAETLVALPLSCQSLGQVATNLERNVPAESVRAFTLEVMSLIVMTTVLLAKSWPSIRREESVEIVSTTIVLAGAAWPIAHPSPHLATRYATDPQMSAFCFDYVSELRRRVLALVTGFSRRGDWASAPESWSARRPREAMSHEDHSPVLALLISGRRATRSSLET
jgi:hypothetical protein